MIASDVTEIRRRLCTLMGELGTIADSAGTIDDTIHSPSGKKPDARARAETLASAIEAAGMVATLADELVQLLAKHSKQEEAAA